MNSNQQLDLGSLGDSPFMNALEFLTSQQPNQMQQPMASQSMSNLNANLVPPNLLGNVGQQTMPMNFIQMPSNFNANRSTTIQKGINTAQQQQQFQLQQQIEALTRNQAMTQNMNQVANQAIFNPNQLGLLDPTLANELSGTDWRLTLFQQDRYQIIFRLSQEVMKVVPPDQKSDARIQGLARGLESQIYEKSSSKQQYFMNVKNQIMDIQKKAQANMKSEAGPSQMPLMNQKPPQPPYNVQENHMAKPQQEKPMSLPVNLSLSDQEKVVVQEKINSLLHLHSKIPVLMRTIAQIGGKAESDKLQRLASIRKAIDYQLEGFTIDRYTLSAEIASTIYPSLMRFFQYGEMLLKQKQQEERNKQLAQQQQQQMAQQQISENLKGNLSGIRNPANFFFQGTPQMQPNTNFGNPQLGMETTLGMSPTLNAQQMMNSFANPPLNMVNAMSPPSQPGLPLTVPPKITGTIMTPKLPNASPKIMQGNLQQAQLRQQQYLQKLNMHQQQQARLMAMSKGASQEGASGSVLFSDVSSLFATSPVQESALGEGIPMDSRVNSSRGKLMVEISRQASQSQDDMEAFFNLDYDPETSTESPEQSPAQPAPETPTSQLKRKRTMGQEETPPGSDKKQKTGAENPPVEPSAASESTSAKVEQDSRQKRKRSTDEPEEHPTVSEKKVKTQHVQEAPTLKRKSSQDSDLSSSSIEKKQRISNNEASDQQRQIKQPRGGSLVTSFPSPVQIGTPLASPTSPRLTLPMELEQLAKEYKLEYEVIELDALDSPRTRLNMSPVQQSTLGKVMILCSLPPIKTRFVFRLSSRAEYEKAIMGRKASTPKEDGFYEFGTVGCGLEEFEPLELVDHEKEMQQLQKFARELGVGMTGNRVRITDIVKFASSKF